MKIQLLLGIACLVVFVRCEDNIQQTVVKDGGIDRTTTTTTTTESDPLISSLENIVNKVKSMKERVEKTLNDTATDALEKSHHDFLLARGYSFTFGVGYHKLYLTELSWKEALHRCRHEKAHLAVIDSLAERKALGDLMKKRMSMLQGVESLKAYVGVHDYCENGSWISVFFDVLDDAKHIQWREDTANYLKGAGPNCAVIDDEEYLSAVKCIKKQPFICEMESP